MPPPPPPSASYNLKLDDFSDSEEEESNDYYSQNQHEMDNATAVHHTDGYVVEENATVVSLTELRQQYADGNVSKEEFTSALHAHQANNASNNDSKHRIMMTASGDSSPEVVEAFNVTALTTDDSDNEDDEGDDDLSGKMDIDEQDNTDGGEISSPGRKKKKKKKKVGVYAV